MKESEIRKREILDRYLGLVEKDCCQIFADAEEFIEVNCPACDSREYTGQFKKNGFAYVTCDRCQTLYVRYRPSFDKLNQFYAQSESTKYWVNEFFKPVAETRREKIFKPRVEYVVNRFGKDPSWTVGDIGAGFGLFLQELKAKWPSGRYIAIEPSIEQGEICNQAGLDVECCALEELKGYDGRFDLLTAFELFEHLHQPKVFLQAARRLLKPGGRLLATTLNGEGFDIQVLWEKSKSIYPPCHINFFNPGSITRLLEANGFEIEELETPGQLDWDIVEGMIINENASPGHFFSLLAKKGTVRAKQALQEWLRDNKLSSHMRVLARKVK